MQWGGLYVLLMRSCFRGTNRCQHPSLWVTNAHSHTSACSNGNFPLYCMFFVEDDWTKFSILTFSTNIHMYLFLYKNLLFYLSPFNPEIKLKSILVINVKNSYKNRNCPGKLKIYYFSGPWTYKMDSLRQCLTGMWFSYFALFTFIDNQSFRTLWSIITVKHWSMNTPMLYSPIVPFIPAWKVV